MSLKTLLCLSVAMTFLSACGSSAIKQRKEQREKLAQSSKYYCDFINGDAFPSDIEVQLNLELGKHCDSEKPFSVTPYKTPSETQGLIYCCSRPEGKAVGGAMAVGVVERVEKKVEVKKTVTPPAPVAPEKKDDPAHEPEIE